MAVPCLGSDVSNSLLCGLDQNQEIDKLISAGQRTGTQSLEIRQSEPVGYQALRPVALASSRKSPREFHPPLRQPDTGPSATDSPPASRFEISNGSIMEELLYALVQR